MSINSSCALVADLVLRPVLISRGRQEFLEFVDWMWQRSELRIHGLYAFLDNRELLLQSVFEIDPSLAVRFAKSHSLDGISRHFQRRLLRASQRTSLGHSSKPPVAISKGAKPPIRGQRPLRALRARLSERERNCSEQSTKRKRPSSSSVSLKTRS